MRACPKCGGSDLWDDNQWEGCNNPDCDYVSNAVVLVRADSPMKGFTPRAEVEARKLCKNCGERGSHFVPPSFGQEGFYVCNQGRQR